MQINQVKTKGNIIVLFLAIIVIITALIVMFQPSEDVLPVYTSEEPSDISEVSETSIDIDTIDYTDDNTNFTMPIPKAWTKVIKNGSPTYIHSASATSLQICHSTYDPTINNVSIESITNDIQNNGYTLVEVNFFSSSSYLFSYLKANEDNPTFYISYVIWDLKDIYTINGIVSQSNYSKMFPYFDYCLKHISWKSKTNIPNELNITYVNYGNFSFAYPVDWSIGSNESAIVATDTNTGSTITVKSTENAVDYSNITQIQYNQYLSSGRSNFIMQQYANDGNIIHGEATYYINGVQYGVYQYLISTGTFEIEITLDCPSEAISDILPKFQNAMKYFHLYDNDNQVTENNEYSDVANIQSSEPSQVSKSDGFSASIPMNESSTDTLNETTETESEVQSSVGESSILPTFSNSVNAN